MDIATLGVAIDPTPTKQGADAVKDQLKQIAVSAEEMQDGIVAAFVDTENQRKVVIRDSAAVQQQAAQQTTAVETEESGKRRQVTATEAAAAREATQARLQAAQQALEAQSTAEIAAAQRSSQNAIEAAQDVAAASLAAIQAVQAGRLGDAQEAIESAKLSSDGMIAEIQRQKAAYAELGDTQLAMLSSTLAAQKSAAEEASSVQKSAIEQVQAAEKAAAEQAKADLAAQTAAAKEAAAQQVAAAKAAAAAEKAAAQAANNSTTGWAQLEHAGIQVLAMLGLVAPEANTALVALQAVQAGAALTGASMVVLGTAITGLIVVVGGLAGAVVLFKSLADAAGLEPLRNQLADVQGSFAGVQKQMEGIEQIEHDSGGLFNLPSLTTAERDLQLFSGGALAGADALKLVANAAVASNSPVQNVAAAVGRMYESIMNGVPIDRFTRSLQSMGVMSVDTATKLKNMQTDKAAPAEIWKTAEAALSSYSGALAQYAGTTEGMIGQIKVDIVQALSAFGEPILPLIEPAIAALEARLKGFIPLAAQIAQTLVGVIRTASWDDVWQYIGNRAELALYDAWTNIFQAFKDMWVARIAELKQAVLDMVASVETAYQKIQDAISGKPVFTTVGHGSLYNTPGAPTAGQGQPAPAATGLSTEMERLRQTIADQEQRWQDAGKPADAAGGGLNPTPDGKLPSPAPGSSEPLQHAVRAGSGYTFQDDENVMNNFIQQLAELTAKLQSGEVSPTEFSQRQGQLQDSTVKQLGDPQAANDLYSNPQAADKVWQDVLNKWKVMQQARVNAANQADAAIASGSANMTESLERGFQKVAESWGNASQMMEKAGETIGNSIATNLTDNISAFLEGTKDAKTAFRDFTVAVLQDIVKTCVQLLIELAIKEAIQALSGGGTVGAAGSIDQQALASDGGDTTGASVSAGASSAGGGSSSSTGSAGAGVVTPPLPSGSGGVDFSDPFSGSSGGTGESLDFAQGGPAGTVWGGNGGVDDIPAYLTRGEYVIPKDAAAYYGTSFLDSIRDRRAQPMGFAGGGAVPGPVTGGGRGVGGNASYGININLNTGAGQAGQAGSSANGKDTFTATQLKALAKLIGEGAKRTIVEENRPGGLLNAI